MWGIGTVGRTKLNLLTPTDDEPSTAPATVGNGKSGRNLTKWGISTAGRTKVNLLTPTDGEASIAPTAMDDGESGRKFYQMGH